MHARRLALFFEGHDIRTCDEQSRGRLEAQRASRGATGGGERGWQILHISAPDIPCGMSDNSTISNI